MKRLEILLVNNSVIDLKNDYRYVITQLTNFDDVFVTFQTSNFDIVAFPEGFENAETMNMIKKFIEVQKLNTQVIFLNKDVDIATIFAELYQNQERNETFEAVIKDDALKNEITNNGSCSL